MKQKILNRIFLFLLFFLTWLDVTKFLTISVSKIGESIPIFPLIQINLLQAKNEKLVRDAVQETSKMLLHYFVPQLAHEPWQPNFIFADLLADHEPEIVFTLSRPPDRAILVLLQKKDNHYFIVFFQDHLFPLTKLEVLPVKNEQSFLVTSEDQQKQWGALGSSTLVKLWRWEENSLRETFAEKTSWEINWQSTWQNPASKLPQWYNLKQNFTITYHQENEKIIIKTKGQQQFSEAPVKNTAFPAPYDFPSPFTLLKARDVFQEYYWDNNWQKFILKTCLYYPPEENTPAEIAVLQDLDQHLESLAFGEQQQYQVINKKGETFPLPKNSLINVP